MKYFLLVLFVSFGLVNGVAQKSPKQDLGINAAGLFIRNDATIAPAFFYKYKLGDYQLRLQLALSANLNSKDRDFSFKNGTTVSNNTLDTNINFDPGKNIRYGVVLGFQRNKTLKNSDFSYFYGIDLIYMKSEFTKTGKGTVISGSTTKITTNIKTDVKNDLLSYGIGLPLGITYQFGKRYYASLEAKFVVVYQKGKDFSLTETSRIQNQVETITRTEVNAAYEGFDLGIKPLSGLSVGVIF